MFTWNQLIGFTFIFELYPLVYIVQALTFIPVAYSLVDQNEGLCIIVKQ